MEPSTVSHIISQQHWESTFDFSEIVSKYFQVPNEQGDAYNFFDFFLTLPEPIRTPPPSPPFINFQGMIKYNFFSVAKYVFLFM